MAALTQYEMIMNGQGLVVNSFRDAEGRGAYFSGSSGTSEGQFLFILGMLDCYRVTGNTKALAQAEKALSSLLTVLYRNMPIPPTVTETDIFAPHWLYAVKYDFNSTILHYDGLVNFSAGVGYLNLSNVRTVFNARTLDANYLWDNPYSSLTSGSMYAVSSHEYVEGSGEKITLATPYNGQLKVTYSTKDGAVIKVNEPYEAWPDWRKLDSSEIEAACDVFIWAYRSFMLAYQLTGNATWSDAARATQQQAAIAMDINDGRDWLKPTWTDSPFSDGARFSFSDRTPQPAFNVGAYGVVDIGVPSYLSGTGEVQYGKASVGDVYQSGDSTLVEVGASRRVNVDIYIDLYQEYSEANRYFKTLTLAGTGDVQSFTLTIGDFKNKAGSALPAGSPVYTVGVRTNDPNSFTLFIRRIRQSPPRNIAYYPGAVPFTANFSGNPPMLIDWRGPVYAGYQAPAMWMITGNNAAALTCTQLLHDAQDAWVAQTGHARGPFAPVFYFNRTDAVQYGSPNTFGWNGPDPNTVWGGYEYRPLAECAETVWLASQGTTLYNLAAQVAEDFLSFLNNTSVWPVSPVQGPPTDFPITGAVWNYEEAHMTALIWRTVIKLDWKRRLINGEYSTMNPVHLAIHNRCIAFYAKMWITEGVMAGTFSQDPDNHEWYGFWHGEILSTLALVYEWSSLPQINNPTLANTCLTYMDGLVKWSVSNSARTPSEWGANLFPYQPDWADGITEQWDFVTSIITSFNGSEQRLGQRQNARRSLTLNLTLLSQRNAANYQAVLQARQNKPVLLPQWHIGTELAATGIMGSDTLLLAATPDDTITEGTTVVLSSGNATHVSWVRWVSGTTLVINDPLEQNFPAGTKVASAFNAVLNNSLSSNRLTAIANQAQINFTMLPQEDGRTLPSIAAPQVMTVNGDTREVVTLVPNWSDAATIEDGWTYILLSNNDGPITPADGENFGRRTIKYNVLLKDPAAINAFHGLLNRLRGRQVACWLPSWTRDFEMTAETGARNTLTVLNNSFMDEGLLVGSSRIGIAVIRTDGTIMPALVTSLVKANDNVTLTLDRNLAVAATFLNTAKICVLYKARQASDTAQVTWHTNSVAECSMSFITVKE